MPTISYPYSDCLKSLLQNLAAGFSLRRHRLESLWHRGFIEQSKKTVSL
jgi:hypothetical protein